MEVDAIALGVPEANTDTRSIIQSTKGLGVIRLLFTGIHRSPGLADLFKAQGYVVHDFDLKNGQGFITTATNIRIHL